MTYAMDGDWSVRAGALRYDHGGCSYTYDGGTADLQIGITMISTGVARRF